MAKQQRKKKSQLPQTQCKGCEKKFYPQDRRQHFHNPECREAYYARTLFNRTDTIKTCLHCGTSFPTSMPKKQKFCSDDCRLENRKKLIENAQTTYNTQRIKFYGDRFKTLQLAEFKCSYCGKDVSDNIKLDVEPDGDNGYRTICSECVMGKSYQ